jgi:subtilisin family serine protease
MHDATGIGSGAAARALSQATGRGVRVAVIDSGVNPKHPHVNGVAGGIAIGVEPDNNCYIDFHGHGTAVLAAIKEKAPEASYYAAKIYYRSLRTDIDFLIKALRWAIDARMDVINLSLGTPTLAYADRLIPVVQCATEAGIVLVAAAEIDSTPALPGTLPGVIGVGPDWRCARDTFRYCRSDHGPRWFASSYPRTLPGVPLSRNLSGVSFSVANMSGFVVRACEQVRERSLSAICQALRDEARRLNSFQEQPPIL